MPSLLLLELSRQGDQLCLAALGAHKLRSERSPRGSEAGGDIGEGGPTDGEDLVVGSLAHQGGLIEGGYQFGCRGGVRRCGQTGHED